MNGFVYLLNKELQYFYAIKICIHFSIVTDVLGIGNNVNSIVRELTLSSCMLIVDRIITNGIAVFRRTVYIHFAFLIRTMSFVDA